MFAFARMAPAVTAALCALFCAVHAHPHLAIPKHLASLAKPIWAAGGQLKGAEFVMARREFVAGKNGSGLSSAVAFVTAQQSPLCKPDPRLARNDYGVRGSKMCPRCVV
jgi:hypothetical protein